MVSIRYVAHVLWCMRSRRGIPNHPDALDAVKYAQANGYLTARDGVWILTVSGMDLINDLAEER